LRYDHRVRRLVLLLLLVTAPAWARRASWQQVGADAADAGAVARTFAGGALVSVDAEGSLHALDPDDGDRATRGAADHGDTRLLFGDASRLVALADGGALYDVDVDSGAWRQIGERCAWGDTVAGAMLSGQLYTIEASGGLYATDLGVGTWREVGDGKFADVVALLADGDALYVLDRAGTLARVDPSTGASTRVGAAAANPGAIAAAILGRRLYTVDADGALRVTTLSRGAVKPVKPKLAGAVALFAHGEQLLAIDAAGTVRALAP